MNLCIHTRVLHGTAFQKKYDVSGLVRKKVVHMTCRIYIVEFEKKNKFFI